MEGDFRYLEPVRLDFDEADPESFVRSLRTQMRERIKMVSYGRRIRRAVYVIRMSGSFVIAYAKRNSPVLYIGRGNAQGRVVRHIGRWIKDVSSFGNDTQVEIRILIPRRPGRPDFYKNVEADLLGAFKQRYGGLPYFNSRSEASFAKVVKYSPSQEKRMKSLLGVGRGRRPWWALRPTRGNPTFKTYRTGSAPD